MSQFAYGSPASVSLHVFSFSTYNSPYLLGPVLVTYQRFSGSDYIYCVSPYSLSSAALHHRLTRASVIVRCMTSYFNTRMRVLQCYGTARTPRFIDMPVNSLATIL